MENKANEQELKHVDMLLGQCNATMRDTANDFIRICQNPGPRISTGNLELDKALAGGLSNELYVLGAETSTGKSAFVMHIAQNIAKSGIDVLYFALEMGRMEFYARGISEISYKSQLENRHSRAFTAGDVLYWSYDEDLQDFTWINYEMYKEHLEEYLDTYGDHLRVIEGDQEGLTVTDVANAATLFKRKTGKTPVVIVDYLQLLRPKDGDFSQADRKTKTDVIITTLKTLSSQIGMPVIAISSLSRSGYGTNVSSTSFKESGDIEYTSGVLLGWNWDGVTNAKEEDAKEEMKRCNDRHYRIMTLEVLKFRNGKRNGLVKFKYYPAYNYFTAYTKEDEKKEKEENNRLRDFS